MEPIRVVWGTGTGPTALAAYDAALAEANLHDYNLIQLSSVIPADVSVTEVSRAPDLGPIGSGLPVVEAVATAKSGPVSAALAWARCEESAGLFYEEAGRESNQTIIDRVLTGIEAGIDRRDREFEDPTTRVVSAQSGQADEYVCAGVWAAYGETTTLIDDPSIIE